MKNNYDLINELFSSRKSVSSQIITESQPTTKRTFKILDEYWESFLYLTKVEDTTQADLINNLIKKAIEENRDKIEQYKDFFKQKTR